MLVSRPSRFVPEEKVPGNTVWMLWTTDKFIFSAEILISRPSNPQPSRHAGLFMLHSYIIYSNKTAIFSASVSTRRYVRTNEFAEQYSNRLQKPNVINIYLNPA
jgi:hypothetical protein